MLISQLLKTFIESKIINVFITLVILINAVTLGLETSEKLLPILTLNSISCFIIFIFCILGEML